MPKLVSELAQGAAFSRSSDGDSYQATRKWKVILNAPNEAWNISVAAGINIGDAFSEANPIPCVSLDVAADGESRLVRIVTAQFRSSASASPGAPDPKTQNPTVRPAMYSMTTSLSEIAAWGGSLVTGGASGQWQPAVNPCGDLVDGITRLEPVLNINIDQYSSSDQSGQAGYVGYVNIDQFTFSSLSIPPHCAMLQSVSSQAVVEQFGNVTFRGFKVTFGFAVRQHWTVTRDGFQAIGWDMAVPLSGFNIINSNAGSVDIQSLCWEHEDGKVKMNGNSPASLAAGTSGTKVRAQVTVAAGNGGWAQRPAAQPVALNDDGTPRSPNASPKVLINRICIQPEVAFGNNFSNFGIRWFG